MLGDNGEVLCPGMAYALLNPRSYLPDIATSSSKKIDGRIAEFTDQLSDHSTPYHDLQQNQHKIKGAIPSTDELLLTLNEEISRKTHQTSFPDGDTSTSTKCLLWHTPITDPKWCSNCLKKRAPLRNK